MTLDNDRKGVLLENNSQQVVCSGDRPLSGMIAKKGAS